MSRITADSAGHGVNVNRLVMDISVLASQLCSGDWAIDPAATLKGLRKTATRGVSGEARSGRDRDQSVTRRARRTLDPWAVLEQHHYDVVVHAGNPAVIGNPLDRWLCDPFFRKVCLLQMDG